MPDHGRSEQALLKRRVLAFAVLALIALPLTGCGKKPAHVDPPPGVENDTYPRVYPDPATDPKP